MILIRIKIMKKNLKINPTLITKIPKNPLKAFGLGVIEGKKYIYDQVLNNNASKTMLKRLLTHQNMIDALDIIKNSDISKMYYYDTLDLGDYLGRKKAIEFVFDNNFNLNLIQEQWFIVANKLENFE